MRAIPRVSSYTNTLSNDGKTLNTSAPKQSKPDYSRRNFNDVESKTGMKGPRVVGNEFEDLLGGFKKTQGDNYAGTTKSIAQLRKEELVRNDLFLTLYL